MLIQIFGIILFIGLGIMFLKGKGGFFLIYQSSSHSIDNAPSEAGDENPLEKKICKSAAMVCFVIGVALVKYTIGNFSELTWLINSSTALLAITVLIMLLSLFKGNFIKE